MFPNSGGKFGEPATGSVSGSTPGIAIVLVRHRPERSGLPSAVRGAGAVRFGLPSLPFGTPGVGWLTHWAAAGVQAASTIHTTAVFIGNRWHPTPLSAAAGEILSDATPSHHTISHAATRRQDRA